jgi:hypothetical protein
MRAGTARVIRVAVLASLLLATACGPGPVQDLDGLMVRDSTYLDPVTLEPFSGRIVRFFPHDTTLVEVEGTLEEGTWAGELTVYHPNGGIRDQGRLVRGVKCGAWIEDRPDRPPQGIYEEVRQEVESLSIYPDCPNR